MLEAPAGSGAPPLLRFAAAYGFRNIQSLMRKIKAGKCEYDYVEVGRRKGGEPEGRDARRSSQIDFCLRL